MKNLIVVLTAMIFTFVSTTNLHSEIVMQANQVQASEIKKQIQQLPSGTIIEVRLNNGHKVIGTLITATDEGFRIRAKDDSIKDIAFKEVASIKKRDINALSKGVKFKPVIWVAIIVGAIVGATAAGLANQ